MASLTLDLADRWPAGTSLSIRPRSNFGSSTPPVPGQAPLGSATATATSDATTGIVSFTGLPDDTLFVVTDAGGTKYVQASTLVNHGGVVKTDATGRIPEAELPTTAELTTHKSAASGYAALDSTTRVSLAQLGRVVPALWTGASFTVYVDRHNGSDSNSGRSEADALATLEPAIAMLNQSVHGGRVVIVGPDAGAYTVSAGQHFVRGVQIESISPLGVEIQRNFDTTNSRSVWDAVTTAAGGSVTSATATFSASDTNRIVAIYGAGTNGGTYFDFATFTNSTTLALTGTTPIARSSATDPNGVKMSIWGDWNRVVTDAAMTASSKTLASATGAFTSADIGRLVVVAGAGRGNQALCGAIQAVTDASTVTLTAAATNTVSSKRCAIGVETGDLFSFHVPRCGLKDLYLVDPVTDHRNRIGAAIKFVVDDGYGSSTGESMLEDVVVTSSDTQAAWEHDIDFDGSWNQSAGGGGVRKVWIRGGTFFGARRPTEAIRINTGVHVTFAGGGGGGSAPIAGTGADAVQGIAVLDPGRNRPGGSATCVDVHFAGFDGINMDFYSEGQYITFVGGRLGWTGTQPSGRRSIALSSVTADNFICCENVDSTEDSQKDLGGSRNKIITSTTDVTYDFGTQAGPYTVTPTATRGGLRKVVMSSGTLTLAQPTGVAPAGTILGFDIGNSTGGVMPAITWSGSYKQNHTVPASTKRNIITFRFDGTNWNQQAPQGPDF